MKFYKTYGQACRFNPGEAIEGVLRDGVVRYVTRSELAAIDEIAHNRVQVKGGLWRRHFVVLQLADGFGTAWYDDVGESPRTLYAHAVFSDIHAALATHEATLAYYRDDSRWQ